jgi:hypothetical protein
LGYNLSEAVGRNAMQAEILRIEAKKERNDLGLASLGDFQCRPAGTMNASDILERPWITLYCLDDSRRRAVFVETPEVVDLQESTFYYQAQFQHAQRLIVVSYETLHELAHQAGDGFRKLILTYSVGRCGSTLLSRAFSRVEGTVDLSEPDVYLQLTALRTDTGGRDRELKRLIESCTRLLWKPKGKGSTLAIKFRSFSIEIADLFHEVYPEAKTLFLYRDAESWARSQAKAFDVFSDRTKHLLDETLRDHPQFLRRAIPLLSVYMKKHLKARLKAKDYARLLALALASRVPWLSGRVPAPARYLEPFVRSFPMAKFMGLQWLSVMHRYLDLNARGVPMLAVRYETLIATPTPVLRAIFEYCGLPLEHLPAAEEAFAEDSQRGSTLAREHVAGAGRAGFSEEQLFQLREVLQQHPVIQKPDFILPNTVVA